MRVRSRLVSPIALSVPNSRRLSITDENIDSATMMKPMIRPNEVEVPNDTPS